MRGPLVWVVLGSVVLGVAFWLFGTKLLQGDKDQVVELTLWGDSSDEVTLRPLIEGYKSLRPNVKITFVRQTNINYLTRLQTQLRANKGPDIFPIYSSWVPMMIEDLASAPSNLVTLTEISQTYYPVVREGVVIKDKIYGLPVEIDGLGLYYNEEILEAANVAPAKSWSEFIEGSKEVTVKNTQGVIQTSGAALGSVENVDFWPELIALLFLQQPLADLSSPASSQGAEVLAFFTSFVIDPKNKTWDTTLPASSQMFQNGNLAYYFGPLRKSAEFAAASPSLKFKVVPLPQLPGKNIALGHFQALGVSKRSARQKEAWEFIKYLTSASSLESINQTRASLNLAHRAYPRVEMKDKQLADPVVGAYVAQGPIYKSWFLNSGPSQVGVNEEMIKLYSEAITGVLRGSEPLASLQGISQGVKLVLNKYNIGK